MKTDKSKGTSQMQPFTLRLFVAGNAPNSVIARENLSRLVKRLPEHKIDTEIIDVEVNADVAIREGIFVTPALQILKPEPGALIYGNLNDQDVLLSFFPDAK